MPEMFFSSTAALVPDGTQAAIANATGDLVTATYVLAAAGFFIGLGQIGVVVYGINKMIASNDTRNRHHKKVLKDQAKRHKRAMKADARRHTEAMAAETKRHQESITSLRALIRNTGRRNRPIPAR